MTEFATGAWVANLTPLKSDLSVDVGAYIAHARALFEAGAAGLAALGTTGEANSFALDERRAVIAALGESKLDPARILVGVGCCAAPDTIALTRAALDAGLTRVMMLPPFYYKTVTDEGLFQAYARVIDAVGEARLRVIIYDIPPMTGFPLSTALLARLRDAYPGIVVGVKNSSGNWPAMAEALERLPGFNVFAGSEQYLLPALRAGGPGCISAVANLTVAELGALMQVWRTPQADALQEAATRKRVALQAFPTIPALKEIMALRSGNADWRRMRPPLVALEPDRARALAALAAEVNLT